MLNKEQLKKVETFIEQFSSEELIWISGYLAGKANVESSETIASSTITDKITIAYGTETGNSKKLANSLAARAKKLKINARVIALENYSFQEIEKENYFFLILSTHGDGEPPEAAKKFYEAVHSAQNVKLSTLHYSVLALGDTAYPLFCKAGADVDERLEKLGAIRIQARQDCDIDYETESAHWINEVLNKLSSDKSTATAVKPVTKEKRKARQNYKGKIKLHVNLNDTGSNKETYHLEISPEADVSYEPGDSIGILPKNSDIEVQKVLRILNSNGSEFLNFKGETFSLYELLKSKLNILHLPARILDKYGALCSIEKEIKGAYDLADLLQEFPLNTIENNWQKLVNILEINAPRLYSVASSAAAHNGEVHLTVARSSYHKNGELKYGLCSNYLANLSAESSMEFYVQENHLFRLPEDDKDIIMVGPGTGVAPFRAFVAERDARNAPGKNWLFFGDQHQHTDFLYQTDWQNYLDTGVLSKLDVAFSRDGKEKVYVQHKMKQQAKEIFEWLENGAYFYVCGAKEPMSVDVENTLLQIIEEQGNLNTADAFNYLQNIKEEGRYLKDVY